MRKRKNDGNYESNPLKKSSEMHLRGDQPWSEMHLRALSSDQPCSAMHHRGLFSCSSRDFSAFTSPITCLRSLR